MITEEELVMYLRTKILRTTQYSPSRARSGELPNLQVRCGNTELITPFFRNKLLIKA